MQDPVVALRPAVDHLELVLQAHAIRNEGYYRTLYHQAVAGAAPPLRLDQSQAWFARARRVIPGCAQTFSKGYTQYVYATAREKTALDKNKLLDPTKVLAANPNETLSATFRIDQIPDVFKQLITSQLRCWACNTYFEALRDERLLSADPWTSSSDEDR